ncbi:MAG: apolipoprotein N-acyltransferase [Armatimonadetes bacterium]|nr:apolipoprotein N-acyltransferase [Armatimonadota bacterium]
MQKRNLLLATISGLLLALAMPKPGMWPLAWVALVPLLVVMRRSGPRAAAVCGFVTGTVYFGVILFWLTLFGHLPWVATVFLLGGLPMALFAVVGCRLMPERIGWWGYIAIPAAWTAVQWLRSLGPLGLPWGSMAHIHANVLGLIQISSLTGAWGIDFLVCLFNVAIIGTLSAKRGRWLPLGLVCALTVATFTIGTWAVRSAPTPAGRVRVAIIQGNLSQDVNVTPDYLGYAFDDYESLSREAAKSRPDFIVWPETTLPAAISHTGWEAAISRLARETDANYIIGACDSSNAPSNRLNYNTAHFYSRSGLKLGVYHKVHLVPYGEYVPLREQMPFLKRYGIRERDVLPGDSHNLINTEIGKLGVGICFESLFSQISRLETNDGAAVLVVITNDGWFQRSQAAYQHLMMARLRAVENRRYVIRAAATGISAVIDPYGRIISELGIYRRGIVEANIEPMRAKTPYTRMGDVFAYICVAITIAASVAPKRK